jgi:hypothetical protein
MQNLQFHAWGLISLQRQVSQEQKGKHKGAKKWSVIVK